MDVRDNSHDDDDSTSHSLLLTSSLAKTGGRSSPYVADKSKTFPLDNTTTAAFNSPSTSSDTIPIDETTTMTFPPFPPSSYNLPPSVKADYRKRYQKHGRLIIAYRKWKKSSSQPPILSPDKTAGRFFWSDNNDIPSKSLLCWTNDLLQIMSPHPVSLVELPNCNKIKNGKPITTDNSQPPILSTDITAGPLDGNDDSTEYDKTSFDESFWEPCGIHRRLEIYAVTPYCNTDSLWLGSDDDDSTEYDEEDQSWLQSTAYSRQIDVEYLDYSGQDRVFKPLNCIPDTDIVFDDKIDRISDDDDNPEEDYTPNYSILAPSNNSFQHKGNDCTKWKMNEEGSWIPTTTNTPHDKCTSKLFGPAPPPDHPRYKPRYDHFSHPIPSCPKVAADDATNDTESTVDDATAS